MEEFRKKKSEDWKIGGGENRRKRDRYNYKKKKKKEIREGYILKNRNRKDEEECYGGKIKK